MNEPQTIFVRAISNVLSEVARGLRAQGWPAEIVVDYVPERETYAVSLRIELPLSPIPLGIPPAQERGHA